MTSNADASPRTAGPTPGDDSPKVANELREAMQRLELALAAGEIGMWSLDLETGRLTIDDRARALWGVEPGRTVLANQLDELLHPDDREKRRLAIERALDPAGSGTYGTEYRTAPRGGAPERWIASRGRTQFQDGRAVSVIGTIRDITARKREEEELARARQMLEARVSERTRQLEAMVDSAVNAIVTIDTRGHIRTVNPATQRLFGYMAAELIGMNVNMLMPEPYRSGHDGYIDAYLSTGRRKIIGIGREVKGRNKSGVEFPIHLVVSEFETDGNRYFTGIITDLTDVKAAELALRQSEQQLAQSQKMEAIGQITGGVAHDFNNLLTVITGNLELLEMSLEKEEDLDLVHRAAEAASMGARLTRRLLTFARRRRLEPVDLDLNEQVLGLTELLKRSLGETIALSTILAPGLWQTRADPSEVENAILNLAVNARDAMPGGGKLVIETRNISLTADEIDDSSSGLAPGDYVLLSVADTGIGMPPQILKRAFEPFFTTKEPGKGTGLGLAVIQGFVRQSGGNVTIYSETGRGTVVNIYLPRTGDPVIAAPASPHSEGALRGNGERVLVVEDNPGLRATTLERLRVLGYAPAAVANAQEAVAELEGDTRFDLVFSDIVMPGMSGFDLARWIATNRPGLPVLLTSGYPGDAFAGAAGESARDLERRLLRKPYSGAELAVALRDALASPGRPGSG